ncbi:MAG: tyrosine-protein phosphatase, partial [Novosphingobium sp.]
MAGAPNFRSMGGTPVAGGNVREGVLYRSDAFADLTPADHGTIARLGLRTVVDLRRDSERAEEPSGLRLGKGSQTLAFSLSDAVSAGAGSDYFGKLLSRPDSDGAPAVMREHYARLP